MAELLLKPRKTYSAACISRFSVKDICDIISVMPAIEENRELRNLQSESMQLNQQLRVFLNRIVNKDKPAFERFYDSTIQLCFSQALRVTKKQDIAEEVVSDVYMQVWNRAASYDDTRSSVMTWLMMICRSRALDALRQRKNQQVKESVNIDAIVEPSSDDNPQDILSAIQEGCFLHDVVSQLKPQQQQLLSLAYFKGLTHSEIANHTNMPLGTVKSQIRRAIIMLKKLIDEQGLLASDKNGGGESYD